MRTTLCTILCAVALTAPAAAQRVTGRVVASEAGEPVAGALVHLLRDDGARVASFLSDSTGRFHFDGFPTGSYQLRAERIGHATATLAIAIPDDTDALLQLVAPPAAIALAAIAVRREGRCTARPSAAAAAARIWDEARKSLEVARFAAAQNAFTFRSARYLAELDAAGTTVLSRRIRPSSSSGLRSFRPPGLDTLDAIGFVVAAHDSLSFFAPDADVLLSDSFLDHHCFEAVAGLGERRGLAGLHFRPVPDRRVPEIEGTLWLDAATGALLEVEFRYVQTDQLGAAHGAHGRIDFDRTPSGLVYVNRWFIRMPRAVVSNGRVEITGWLEEGGLVHDVWSSARFPRLRGAA